MAREFTRLWRSAFAVAVALATGGLVATSAHPIGGAAMATIAIAIGWAWTRVVRGEERQRSKADVAHISHELRTPLTSVLGIMDVMEDQSVPLERGEMKELIALAHGEALHMSHVVDNLIASSRVARDLLKPESGFIDLLSVVEQALQRVPSVDKRTFVSHYQDSFIADADPALVLQILLNLLQNIERYAPDGEVEIVCTVTDDDVILSISDDGPGLPPSTAFTGKASRLGLGLGLPLSRTLAQLMGGELRIGSPRRTGATLQLILPRSAEIPSSPLAVRQETGQSVALSPRARLLVNMTEALSNRSLDRVVMGLQKMCTEMLDARSAILAIPTASGGFDRAGAFGAAPESRLDAGLFLPTMNAGHPTVHTDLPAIGAQALASELGGDAALFIPVMDDGTPVGVFAIGWTSAADLPGKQGRAIASALAQLAAFAIDRSSLVEDAAFERELRATVMESLPLAISIFAGDPPQVIDWNRREREMLGIDDDSLRPSDLAASQQAFDVRFADGTELDIDSAPVTQAIRTGESTGPFLLRIRRADGTETITRTYCAPFFDRNGDVIGAVVTSEELDAAVSSGLPDKPNRRSA